MMYDVARFGCAKPFDERRCWWPVVAECTAWYPAERISARKNISPANISRIISLISYQADTRLIKKNQGLADISLIYQADTMVVCNLGSFEYALERLCRLLDEFRTAEEAWAQHEQEERGLLC